MAIGLKRSKVGNAIAFRPTLVQEERLTRYLRYRRLEQVAIALREIIDLGLDAFEQSDEGQQALAELETLVDE